MPGTELQIEAALHDWYAVLHVHGGFCHGSRPAARLRDEAVRLPLPDPPCLVLDLGGVVGWDDGGVGAVIGTGKRVASDGGRMVVAAAPADLLAHFHRMRLDAVFGLYENVEQAVEALRSAP